MSSSPSLLCQDEVAEHVVNHQPGARVSSDFATFPSTTFVKVSAATDKLSLLIIYLFSWEFIEEGGWLRTQGTHHTLPSPSWSNTELFPVFRRRRRSRPTRCWWVGSWCRVPAVRSRSTASSCHSVSCREFTVCCGPELHLPCNPACCTNKTPPPPPPLIISLAAWSPLQGQTSQTRK